MFARELATTKLPRRQQDLTLAVAVAFLQCAWVVRGFRILIDATRPDIGDKIMEPNPLDDRRRRRKKKKRKRRSMDEGAYICPSCGEQIVIPLDISAGDEQEYVEDCPVCCNPNIVHVEFFEEGEQPRVWADAE